MSDSGTASEDELSCHSLKRRKLNTHEVEPSTSERHRSISPPRLRRTYGVSHVTKHVDAAPPAAPIAKPVVLSSPIQLTHIKDLPEHLNVDSVKLSDILGDPLIRECWQFNFLIDLDFLM